MIVRRASVALFQWFPILDIASNPEAVAAPFQSLAGHGAPYPPQGLPVLKLYGKVTPLGRSALESSPHTAKLWNLLQPLLPLQVHPEFGIEYERGPVEVRQVRLRAFLHSFGIIVIADFDLVADPGVNAAALPRLLTRLERGDAGFAVSSKAFRRSRGFMPLFREMRLGLMSQVLKDGATPLPADIAPYRTFCIFMPKEGDFPQTLHELESDGAAQLAAYSVLERSTGNQDAADTEMLERRSYCGPGREAGTGVDSGWVLGSMNGLASYIREGRDAATAERSRRCHFHNLANIISHYRLYHSWLAAAARTGAGVPEGFLRSAAATLKRMDVEYPRWWIRWGAARLALRNEVAELLRDQGLSNVVSSGGLPEVFLSYAHEDGAVLKQLRDMFSPAARQRKLVVRADTGIEPGDEWERKVRKWMRTAKAAVLLVTPDFLNSDYIMNVELPVVLDAVERRGLKLFWVPVKDSLWRTTKLVDRQCFGDPEKPWQAMGEAERNAEVRRLAEAVLAAVA